MNSARKIIYFLLFIYYCDCSEYVIMIDVAAFESILYDI